MLEKLINRNRKGGYFPDATQVAKETTEVLPQYGRTNDVLRLYGLRRGTLYRLHRQGKVKSCLLRVVGQKSGVRLWHLESIRSLINEQMAAQSSGNPQPMPGQQSQQKVPAGSTGL